jgi:hypothetical protein
MNLDKSETVLRLIVALALGLGFVGFATHGRDLQHGHVAHVDMAQLPGDGL